jgi:hypothetical protein
MKTTTRWTLGAVSAVTGALLLGGCFAVRDPLGETDGGAGAGAGMDMGTGTAATGSGFAGSAAGTTWMGGTAGTTGGSYAGTGVAGTSGFYGCELVWQGGTVPVCTSYSGAPCDLIYGADGLIMCVQSYGCTDFYYDEMGNLICLNGGVAGASAGGGAAGIDAGSMGTAGAYAGSYAGGAGGFACDCDDGNACTRDICDFANGQCTYESLNTMTDRDGDNFSDGCDCDDDVTNVNPGQTAYFQQPFIVSEFGGGGAGMGGTGSTSFDYNCDGYQSLRFGAVASSCEVSSGVCVGAGWIVQNEYDVPACGTGGAYQVCQFDANNCTAGTIMLLQSCR